MIEPNNMIGVAVGVRVGVWVGVGVGVKVLVGVGVSVAVGVSVGVGVGVKVWVGVGLKVGVGVSSGCTIVEPAKYPKGTRMIIAAPIPRTDVNIVFRCRACFSSISLARSVFSFSEGRPKNSPSAILIFSSVCRKSDLRVKVFNFLSAFSRY